MPRLARVAIAVAGCTATPQEAAIRDDIVKANPDVVTDGIVAVGFGTEPHCSGVLVSPHVVVTAAHCIPEDVDGLVALAGWDLGGPTVSIAAHVATAYPGYDGRANDIGLIALVEPMPVPPIALATSAPVSGDGVVVAGFGRSDDGHAGVKYAGNATVTAVDATTLTLAADPSLPCDGDSGGPSLDASGNLVGIHALSDCVKLAVDERPAAYANDFIEPFVAQAEGHDACIGSACDRWITGSCSAGGSAGFVPLAVVALFLGFSKRHSSSRKESPCLASSSPCSSR